MVGILIRPRMWNVELYVSVRCKSCLVCESARGTEAKGLPANWHGSYWQSASLSRRSATSSGILCSSAAVRILLCLCLLFMLTRTQTLLRYQSLLDNVFCMELVLVRATYCYLIHCTAKHHVRIICAWNRKPFSVVTASTLPLPMSFKTGHWLKKQSNERPMFILTFSTSVLITRFYIGAVFFRNILYKSSPSEFLSSSSKEEQ